MPKNNPTAKGAYSTPNKCLQPCKKNAVNCYKNTAGFQKCMRIGNTTQSKVEKSQYMKGGSVKAYCTKKYCTTISNKMHY